MHGFSMSFLFILCWLLNNRSILSGLIGVLCYFYNHSHATRVMWYPALRESFSFPFHLLQLIALTYFLTSKKALRLSQMLLATTTLVYLLPWQFAQFSLATQTASIFGCYLLGFMQKQRLIQYLVAQSIALG